MAESLKVRSHAASGAVVGGLFLAGTLAIATIRVSPRTGMITGLALLLPGVAALVGAQYLRSFALLLVASGVGGLASGLGYRCGLEVVNVISPARERAQLVSSYLVVCYAAISLPVIGVGLVSHMAGSLIADAIFGVANMLLAVAALIFEVRRVLHRRHRLPARVGRVSSAAARSHR